MHPHACRQRRRPQRRQRWRTRSSARNSKNDARVTRGASLEPVKENTVRFFNETRKDSAAFFKTKKPVHISPFDSSSATHEAKLAAFHVCDQFRESLHILRRCETEEMRTAHYTVLTATSPEKGFRGTVSKRLKVRKVGLRLTSNGSNLAEAAESSATTTARDD